MTGRQRIDAAMRGTRVPDRVPVMCQLALGHYFLHTPIPAVDIWHDSASFAEALVTLQQRYGFDGILVNLPGRDPAWRERVESVEAGGGRTVVTWKEGLRTIVPRDDNPRVVDAHGRRLKLRSFAAIEPSTLFYVEPHGRLGVTVVDRFPAWQFDTLSRVRAMAPDVSVHGEVFSPFSQLVELIGIEEAMLALVDDPGRVKSCLARLAEGAAVLALGLLDAGADAVLISSAYAGAGFISRRHYEEFVLPFERATIGRIRSARSDAQIYTHTCGAIGDRLDLMEGTGTGGIDTLDPPPLGTIDLATARHTLGDRLFVKGNIDPVNTLLRGTPRDCDAAARERIAAGGPRRFILSSACSVAPATPPENILALSRAAKEAACDG